MDLIRVSAQLVTAVLAAEVWQLAGSETLQAPTEARWSEFAVSYHAGTLRETDVVASAPASGKTEVARLSVVSETLAPKTAH